MSSPISSPGASSRELYQTDTEETQGNPSTAICHRTNQQASTIARCNPLEGFTEQNLNIGLLPPPEALALINYPNALARGVASLCKAGGIKHDFTPAEEQEFIGTMGAVQHPVKNKITENDDGTCTIEFRPKHGLMDLQSLETVLKSTGKFAGGYVSVEQRGSLNGKELSYSGIVLENYQDLAIQRYKQLWEDRYPENLEEYRIFKCEHPNSTMWPEKKKTIDELEKELSYQKRFFLRVIDIMNNKQRESDEETPFDPAFKRIFILSHKDLRNNKVPLLTPTCLTAIFFEYKIKTVPSYQVEDQVEEIDAMPTRKIRELRQEIKTSLKDDPIEMVDLHQVSHLLEKLGGYASSSALVEREYTIDGEERYCTAIVLRNRQDLVDERYEQVKGNYDLSHSLSHEPPKCNYPVPFFQDKKTPKEAQEQLSSQKQLLQKAVENMYVDGVPFDPLFERIYVPTEQERINNGVSVSNLAQTDTILFVYRTSEEYPPKHPVEQICEMIKTVAQEERIETPLPKTSLISRTVEAGLLFFTMAAESLKGIFHFFARGIGTIWQLLWNSSRPE